MKRTAAILLAVTVTSAGAAGVAATIVKSDVPAAFGPPASRIALDDVATDAEKVFGKIDVDASGEIDIDEYAAQAVVYAGLTRFNGLAVIDGREVVHVGLPAAAHEELGLAERTAIDAVARRDYYDVVSEYGPLTADAWIQLRRRDFASADFNADGALQGRELSAYALRMARYDVSTG